MCVVGKLLGRITQRDTRDKSVGRGAWGSRSTVPNQAQCARSSAGTRIRLRSADEESIRIVSKVGGAGECDPAHHGPCHRLATAPEIGVVRAGERPCYRSAPAGDSAAPRGLRLKHAVVFERHVDQVRTSQGAEFAWSLTRARIARAEEIVIEENAWGRHGVESASAVVVTIDHHTGSCFQVKHPIGVVGVASGVLRKPGWRRRVSLEQGARRVGLRVCWLAGRRNTCEMPLRIPRSEEHTSELQSRLHLVCRLLLEKKKKISQTIFILQWRLILILDSFLGSRDSLVLSELFHSLAARPFAARSISDCSLTCLAP